MSLVRHKILVLSGKGGVGKSTVSSQLALALMSAGYRVGLLDVDLCGPSIPTILGLVGQSMVSSTAGWVPVYVRGSNDTANGSTVSSNGDSGSEQEQQRQRDAEQHHQPHQQQQQRMAVMSIGFLSEDSNAPVIWRGPKKTSVIRQFLEEVCWGPLDFLVIDTPPGTSDENISVCEQLVKYMPDGAILVTTPQSVSTDDVRKEVSFCKAVNIPILGIVENMSGFICPCCGEQYNIFSKGGGEALAKEIGVPFIGRIPLDPSIAQACDQGKSFIDTYKDSKSLDALRDFAHSFEKKKEEEDTMTHSQASSSAMKPSNTTQP